MVTGAMTESYDLKTIRKELLNLYSEFTAYILAMAKTADAPPLFNTALTLLNTARKYYADLLARRATIKEVKSTTRVIKEPVRFRKPDRSGSDKKGAPFAKHLF